MSHEKRKGCARSILVLYAFITVTFPFAHNDFVPLENNLSLSSIDFQSGTVHSGVNDLVCPAHNFAQSTVGTSALSHDLSTRQDVAFFMLEYRDDPCTARTFELSARAPPQA